MANTSLFRPASNVPAATATTAHGTAAYALDDFHALAQLVMTGCLRNTFYATAAKQLDDIKELANKVKPEDLAKLAIYARERGYMKDTPALLMSILANRDIELFKKSFGRSIDNAKMLRNFVQIIRSGQSGRKSFGTAPRRAIREWFDSQSDNQLFKNSIGTSPSMSDVIRLVHPKPKTKSREALYAYLLDKEAKDYHYDELPPLVKQYEAYKKSPTGEVPDVPFQMLASIPGLTAAAWKSIAANGGWHMIRMNLNTFVRHGVFKLENGQDDKQMIDLIAGKIRDEETIRKVKVFPYQLLTTFTNMDTTVPSAVKLALQDALEIALQNIPALLGKKLRIFVDVSGSMSDSVTGDSPGNTSATTCIDVAALMAAAFLRYNPETIVLPFDDRVHTPDLNPRDSVMTNATKLAKYGGGGTTIPAPFKVMVDAKDGGDLYILVSDNQSWGQVHDESRRHFGQQETGTQSMKLWKDLKKFNPHAKLVCLDIQPYANTQFKEEPDILNIGGFSDSVFGVIDAFARGELSGAHLVGEIRKIQL